MNLSERRREPEAVLEHIADGAHVVVGVANGEPMRLLDTIEAHADRFHDVRLHQMFPVRKRRYIDGAFPGLRHVSWFLAPPNRAAFHAGTCDLVPNNFSDVPHLMRSLKPSLVVVTVAPADRHGYFSLGCHAEYVAAFIGEVPFFVEVNPRMPRTFGENQVRVDQVVGWCEVETPMVEVPPVPASEIDRRIAGFIAERVPNGATLQVGVGSIPNAVLALLVDHRELGVHTEFFGDGFVDLVERGVVTGSRKQTHKNKIITTSALGTRRLYEFLDENAGVEFWPVNHTNDPWNVAREDDMVTINATLEVDFLGQCASESLGTDYWSSSGGQPDFARGAIMAARGQSFIVLHSTTHDESASRVVPQLHPGAAVTTFKNIVDRVVTEYGVAELRGSSIRERTRRLIALAHPKFRDDLGRRAREIGYL